MGDALAVIPAFQEGPRIEAVVRAASAQLRVLVVDDGSTDDTAARAEAAGATVIRQVSNQGKGAALRKGLRYALERNARAVVTLDADGQHDPAEIPSFLAAFEAERPELIVGKRTSGRCRRSAGSRTPSAVSSSRPRWASRSSTASPGTG